MNTYGRLAAILIALTLFGCKGPLQASSASAAAGGSVAGEGAGATASLGGTRVEGIPDTTLDNKIAFNVTIPAKWKFNGILLQGGIPTCESYAYAVYRATGEDGVTFGEAMPQLMWTWGNGPRPTKGCLPLTGPMGAQEFLKYVSTTMQVEYVGEAPMPDALAKGVQQAQSANAQPAPFYAANHLPAPKNSVDGAAATVRYKNGPVSMMGRLTTYITCTETTQPGMKSMLRGMPDRPASTVGKCTANVAYVTAPESKFAAVVRMWDGPEMGIRQNKEWGDAWVQRYAKNARQVSDGMIQTSWDRLNAQQKEIAHTMAVQQEVHDQFLQTMQEGTDASMRHAADIANANHRMASDMVDYSLDRQTVLNTNTGLIYKITNQVTVGGALQQVHGDGSQ